MHWNAVPQVFAILHWRVCIVIGIQGSTLSSHFHNGSQTLASLCITARQLPRLQPLHRLDRWHPWHTHSLPRWNHPPLRHVLARSGIGTGMESTRCDCVSHSQVRIPWTHYRCVIADCTNHTIRKFQATTHLPPICPFASTRPSDVLQTNHCPRLEILFPLVLAN